jgi:hypothetical protein
VTGGQHYRFSELVVPQREQDRHWIVSIILILIV